MYLAYYADYAENESEFLDSVFEFLSECGMATQSLGIVFLCVAIGLFFIAKFRKVNKEIKATYPKKKKQNLTATSVNTNNIPPSNNSQG